MTSHRRDKVREEKLLSCALRMHREMVAISAVYKSVGYCGSTDAFRMCAAYCANVSPGLNVALQLRTVDTVTGKGGADNTPQKRMHLLRPDATDLGDPWAERRAFMRAPRRGTSIRGDRGPHRP